MILSFRDANEVSGPGIQMHVQCLFLDSGFAAIAAPRNDGEGFSRSYHVSPSRSRSILSASRSASICVQMRWYISRDSSDKGVGSGAG